MDGIGGGCGNGQWMIDQGVVILLTYLARSVLLFCCEGFVVRGSTNCLESGTSSRLSRVSRCSSAVACVWDARRYVQCGMMAIYRRFPTRHSALQCFSPCAKPMSNYDSSAITVARAFGAEELSRHILLPCQFHEAEKPDLRMPK